MDNIHQKYKKQESANQFKGGSLQKRRKTATLDDQKKTMKYYNWNQEGHVFGTMENKICGVKVKPKTLVYFERKKAAAAAKASSSSVKS